MRQCPKCEKFHSKIGTFCSRSCANSRSWSQDHKDRLSGKLVGRSFDRGRTSFKRCVMCNTEFRYYLSERKRRYCSRFCSAKSLSENLRGKTGGNRSGAGRSKSGWYQSVYCGSTFELAWVIFRLDNGLPVKRFHGYITDGEIRYYPDFVDGNVIHEMKGYHTELVDRKVEIAKMHGYDIKLWYKKDLVECFEWVRKTRNIPLSRIHELYEGEKQVFTCRHCGSTFCKRPRTQGIYCSSVCSMKGNRK